MLSHLAVPALFLSRGVGQNVAPKPPPVPLRHFAARGATLRRTFRCDGCVAHKKIQI
jgi:hypothetical protein